MDVSELIQETLDAALGGLGIRTYEGRRQDGAENEEEFVVYTMTGDSVEASADGETIARTATAAVRYYLTESAAFDYPGRRKRRSRLRLIGSALYAAGFDFPEGWVDVQDDATVGFDCWAGVFEFARTVNEGAG